ncbi:MAG TPA: thiol-disulfide oxidoreductase DCC family protein [Flavobacterium sp.]|nr:thiol-disulfide oxidoreductase DCC family protein [Flavobacterium sp.]
MDLPAGKKIILFDGICNLCDSSIQFVIKHDKKDVFRFVALQSELGQQLIKYLSVDTAKIDSIILFEPGKAYYYKAEAALKIAKQLGGIYKTIGWLSIFPKSLANLIYDYIARNRYKWYGKKEACMIPTPELKAKFL